MRGQRKNPRKAVQPFENKKRKIDIFKNYEANGVEKIQRKLEIFSTLISKKSIQGKIVMNHASPASKHRSIPLYKFEDGEANLQKIKARKFMSNLTEGILYWLGIDTKQVSNPRDLFSGEDQKDERNELEKLSGRRLDPYIDIRGK